MGSVMWVLGLGEDQYGLSPLSHRPASPSENAEPFSTPLPSKDMNFSQVEEQIHFRVRALLYDLQCETRGGFEEDVVSGHSNPSLCREGAFTMWVALRKSLGDSWNQKFGETVLHSVKSGGNACLNFLSSTASIYS